MQVQLRRRTRVKLGHWHVHPYLSLSFVAGVCLSECTATAMNDTIRIRFCVVIFLSSSAHVCVPAAMFC